MGEELSGKENEALPTQCSMLAVFPEDTQVPLLVVQTLWQLDEVETLSESALRTVARGVRVELLALGQVQTSGSVAYTGPELPKSVGLALDGLADGKAQVAPHVVEVSAPSSEPSMPPIRRATA